MSTGCVNCDRMRKLIVDHLPFCDICEHKDVRSTEEPCNTCIQDANAPGLSIRDDLEKSNG